MSTIDWIVMIGTLAVIVLYGIYKTRNVSSVKSYLLGDKDLAWWTIGLSIMATQASAITFLSTPGKAYEDGLGFAQFYFGMPVAMVILCIFVLPIYYKLNVYTAYEYLEQRFDIKTRTLTSVLFLIQRGLAAGITVFAPAIILSNILHWNLNITILFIGIIVIIYTVIGGTKAVSVTQKQQMIIILVGMFIAAILLVQQLPSDISFSDAVSLAGKMDKLEVVDFTFNLENSYTFWSGMLGGVFLFLSYFGTDQSQVQRYLSGKSLSESRLGLLFNGIIKVPMQFLVLFVGVLVFLFFQFVKPPLHFNEANVNTVMESTYAPEMEALELEFDGVFEKKQADIRNLLSALKTEDDSAISAAQMAYNASLEKDLKLRKKVDVLIVDADTEFKKKTDASFVRGDSNIKTKDEDYVFISFVIHYLPIGMIGLLLAVIFSAAMSSTASELNALATTTVIDIYKRSFAQDKSDAHYLKASKMFTIMWGLVCLTFALVADLFDNLIEAVNIIGSLFYGSILGIFLVAFFFAKKARSTQILSIIIFGLFSAVATGLFIKAESEYYVSIVLFNMAIGGLLGYFCIDKFFRKIGGQSVFYGAIAAELLVVLIYVLNYYEVLDIAYLWLNLIGCALVIIFSLIFENMKGGAKDELKLG